MDGWIESDLSQPHADLLETQRSPKVRVQHLIGWHETTLFKKACYMRGRLMLESSPCSRSNLTWQSAHLKECVCAKGGGGERERARKSVNQKAGEQAREQEGEREQEGWGRGGGGGREEWREGGRGRGRMCV